MTAPRAELAEQHDGRDSREGEGREHDRPQQASRLPLSVGELGRVRT